MSRRQKSPRPGGFTLLEVLLAVVLSVALTGGMLGLYFGGLRTRDTVTARLDELLAVRLAMQRMTRELRTARPFAEVGEGMTGQADRMRWPVVTTPGPRAWRTFSATQTPSTSPQADVRYVGYRLRMESDPSGAPAVVGLERSEQVVLWPHGLDDADAETIVERRLINSQVRYLRFRYFDGMLWLDEWAGPDLPAAVEITVGFQPADEGTLTGDAEGEVFRRVVSIPSAMATLPTVRGLGDGAGS